MHMPVTFTRFDAADYLKSDEQIAACLEDAAQDGDPAAMAAAAATVARARTIKPVAIPHRAT